MIERHFLPLLPFVSARFLVLAALQERHEQAGIKDARDAAQQRDAHDDEKGARPLVQGREQKQKTLAGSADVFESDDEDENREEDRTSQVETAHMGLLI